MFRGTVIGVPTVLTQLNGAEDRILNAAERGMARGMLGGQSVVRGNASGRPGPRAVTGAYRRSINGDSERAGTTIRGQIGTNAAQGRRLEYGFFGPDRLGRVYNQGPFPHFQPSVSEVTSIASAEMSSAVNGAL